MFITSSEVQHEAHTVHGGLSKETNQVYMKIRWLLDC